MPFVAVGDAKVFYADFGAGDPLVLVHGGFLEHSLWLLVAPALAEDFHVIALDLPGHGQSTGRLVDPAADLETAIAQVADALATFIEQLALGPVHCAGQSAGGGFLLHLASRRPDLVRTMALHEPVTTALLDEEFANERGLQREAGRLLNAGDIEGGLAMFLGSVGGDWSTMPDAGKAIFRKNAHNYTGGRVFEEPLPVPTDPAAIAQPTLFTKGSRSPRFFHVGVDRVAAVMPNAQVATIADAHHAAMLEQPAAYTATVRDFIDRHSS